MLFSLQIFGCAKKKYLTQSLHCIEFKIRDNFKFDYVVMKKVSVVPFSFRFHSPLVVKLF